MNPTCPRCGPAPAIVGGDCWYCGQPVADIHIYTSAACLHDHHTECRQAVGMTHHYPHRCNYCGAACVCTCHLGVPHDDH